MSDSAIVLVADAKYSEHAKSLMVNCRIEGQWGGDIVLIAPEEFAATDFANRGIPIFHVPDVGFLTKFWLFGDALRRWGQVLFLDCDVIVQGSLQRAFDALTATELLPADGKPILADLEDTTAEQSWKVWDKEADDHPAVYTELRREYPWMSLRVWNTAFLLFEPASIPRGTVETLKATQEKYKIANDPAKGGTDQQVIHLILHERMREKPDKLFGWWGHDEPQCRVYSEFRHWRGDEVPIALHYGRWYAPWIPKEPGVDGYRNLRLGSVPCLDIYRRNLARFEELFPREK